MIDTLCPISTLNQQLTNLEQTHIRCFLHCEGWTVKGRDCASALHFFNEITYQTEEWTKQFLLLNSWVISRNPEQGMEFHRLWWTVSLFKCSYLFQLFDFYCLLVQYLLFFEKLLLFDDLEWGVKVHWQLPCKVTFLRQPKPELILVHCRSSHQPNFIQNHDFYKNFIIQNQVFLNFCIRNHAF